MLIHAPPPIILTSRLGCPDSDCVDISAVPFAPSPALTNQTGLTIAQEVLYTAEMRRSYVQHRQAWEALLARPRTVLCCGCDCKQPGALCHRVILARLLVKCGAVYLGEWQPAAAEPWLDLSSATGGAA